MSTDRDGGRNPRPLAVESHRTLARDTINGSTGQFRPGKSKNSAAETDEATLAAQRLSCRNCPMTSDSSKPPRFTVSIAETLVVVAILSALCAFLLPAVNAAREIPRAGIRDAQPPVLPQLKPLYERNPWPFVIGTPIVVTTFLAMLIGIVRFLLPETIRRYFPWKAPEKQSLPPPEPIADSRPAIISAVMAFSATAILIFVASHVRADRTNRRPVVTWVGPIADYVQQAAVLGWLLSAAAVALGAFALVRFRSRLSFLAAVGMGLGLLNYFGSCLFYGLVYED